MGANGRLADVVRARIHDTQVMNSNPPHNPTPPTAAPRRITRTRAAAAFIALSVVAAACGGGTTASFDDAMTAATATTTPGGQTTPTTEPTNEPEALAESEGAIELADTYEAIGNADADVVIVNAQGGPAPVLFSDEIREVFGTVDLDTTYIVNVHQAQTIDPAAFNDADLSFDEAKAADAGSVEMLATVVDHFAAEGKTVHVVGISFGAFVVQDLLATQGNVADSYLIMVGRLDMPEAVWSEFAGGRTVGFIDGTDIVEVPIEEAGMGAETPAGDRNMARLAAGLGHKRYTELLATTDLSNVTYTYGETDEQVGRLTDAEVAFLNDHGASVLVSTGGHGEAIDEFIVDALTVITNS